VHNDRAYLIEMCSDSSLPILSEVFDISSLASSFASIARVAAVLTVLHQHLIVLDRLQSTHVSSHSLEMLDAINVLDH
jgi:hypothetical protein